MSGPPKFFDTPPPRTRGINLDEVNKALAELRDAAHFATAPGSSGERFVPGLSIALVVREGGFFRHHEGFGVKDLGRREPVGADTLFPCASLSKPVSASLLAPKWNGRWNEVVEPYKLAYSPPQPVTLKEWLSHTSGLPDHAGDLIEDMNPSMSRDQILQNIMKFQTGMVDRKYRYTNFGLTMGCLGAIQSTDWEKFSSGALHSLGMDHSTYVFTSAFAPNAGDRVLPHRHVEPSSDDRPWRWRVVAKEEERNPWRQAPAGSLISSARDMTAFLEAHLAGRFGNFPPRGVNEYSLGWICSDYSDDPSFANAINAHSFAHSGAFILGAATHLRIDPDAGVGIAILTNGEPAGVPEALARIFFNDLYQQPGREDFALPNGRLDYKKILLVLRAVMLADLNEKKIENSKRYSSQKRYDIPQTIPEGIVFRGSSKFYGCDVVVERKDKELTLSMGEKLGWRFPLQCYDPDKLLFVYNTIGENEVGISGVRLERGNDGKFQKLTDEWLDQTPAKKEKGSGVGVILAG